MFVLSNYWFVEMIKIKTSFTLPQNEDVVVERDDEAKLNLSPIFPTSHLSHTDKCSYLVPKILSPYVLVIHVVREDMLDLTG